MVDTKPSPANRNVKYDKRTLKQIWSQIYALTSLGDDKNGINSANDNIKNMITDKNTCPNVYEMLFYVIYWWYVNIDLETEFAPNTDKWWSIF